MMSKIGEIFFALFTCDKDGLYTHNISLERGPTLNLRCNARPSSPATASFIAANTSAVEVIVETVYYTTVVRTQEDLKGGEEGGDGGGGRSSR